MLLAGGQGLGQRCKGSGICAPPPKKTKLLDPKLCHTTAHTRFFFFSEKAQTASSMFRSGATLLEYLVCERSLAALPCAQAVNGTRTPSDLQRDMMSDFDSGKLKMIIAKQDQVVTPLVWCREKDLNGGMGRGGQRVKTYGEGVSSKYMGRPILEGSHVNKRLGLNRCARAYGVRDG